MQLFKNLFSKIRKDQKIENISDYEFGKINKLCEKLKIQPKDPHVFAKALTHRSYLERKTELQKSNERLEFLGDAVLGAIVADKLFQKFPNEDEGFLTKTRSHIVDKTALFESAERLELKQFLLYDKRFIKDSEAGIKTVLSDCMEALIGAIYLDQGIDRVEKFVFKWVINPNLESGKYQIDNNYKGQLLEYTHATKLKAPEYVLVSSDGPDHAKEFAVEVKIGTTTYSQGKGRNKKGAEQQAAKLALTMLKEKNKL
jgi:ribonuclease-3